MDTGQHNRPMIMLDLFSGLGGASQVMRERGWKVVSVDVNPDVSPDILADIRDFEWRGPRPDLVWASPPCVEFSRESMPWTRTGRKPDLSLVLATLRVVSETRPRFWVLENVRGAVRWLQPILGAPRTIVFPFHLWGFFPDLGQIDTSGWRNKESLSSASPAERAKIPRELSAAVAIACESQIELPLPGNQLGG